MGYGSEDITGRLSSGEPIYLARWHPHSNGAESILRIEVGC